MQEQHKSYMLRCLDLAGLALDAGNPPVGALIVHDGKVIGEGVESGRTTGDVTNHAEILAIRDAIAKGYKDILHQSRMYTTHEPCVMCSYVIRHHRIQDVIYGITVPSLGGISSQFAILTTSDVPKWGKSPQITGDICVEECHALNEAFQKKILKM